MNPGSREAIDNGCTCAVLDNAHGRGYMGIEGQFVVTETCPLHGVRPAPPEPTDPEMKPVDVDRLIMRGHERRLLG